MMTMRRDPCAIPGRRIRARRARLGRRHLRQVRERCERRLVARQRRQVDGDPRGCVARTGFEFAQPPAACKLETSGRVLVRVPGRDAIHQHPAMVRAPGFIRRAALSRHGTGDARDRRTGVGPGGERSAGTAGGDERHESDCRSDPPDHAAVFAEPAPRCHAQSGPESISSSRMLPISWTTIRRWPFSGSRWGIAVGMFAAHHSP